MLALMLLFVIILMFRVLTKYTMNLPLCMVLGIFYLIATLLRRGGMKDMPLILHSVAGVMGSIILI